MDAGRNVSRWDFAGLILAGEGIQRFQAGDMAVI